MRQPVRLPEFYKMTADGRIERKPGRNHKYNARKTTVDGIEFDSMAEANRYKELKTLVQTGDITNLRLQPEFTLQDAFTDNQGKRQRAIKYRADFTYMENGQRIVEDVKGFFTKDARIKLKMFLLKYPELILRIQK